LVDVGPLLHRHDEFAELRPPVAEMIDANGLVAEVGEDAVECRAYHRGGEMPDVEWLCDVDGAEIYAHRPALAFLLARSDAPIPHRALRQPSHEGCGREEEVEVSSRDLRPLRDVGEGESLRKLLGYDGR